MSTLYNQHINGMLFLVGEINGRKCKNPNAFCKELKETFRWPNGTHCMEAMFVMDWCVEKNFKIIVNQFNTISDDRQKQWLIDELACYENHWKEKRKQEKNDQFNHFLIEYR
jgi:hypothetical protein